MTLSVAVIGGSGFVGSHVADRLILRGIRTSCVPAPRVEIDSTTRLHPGMFADEIASLADSLTGVDVVINCAGDPDASSRNRRRLMGANGALPFIALKAAAQLKLSRFVHVSSAVVQGASPTLDSSPPTADGMSAYAESKIAGELAILNRPAGVPLVVYRPPSVHSPARRVTRSVRRLAKSPFSSVIGAGNNPTPQAHILNVAEAICELALSVEQPPQIVIHPSEGWTTGELMRVFGDGKEPTHIPEQAGPAIRFALHTMQRSQRLAANARRVEMMWFGQDQAPSWLSTKGWTPPADRSEWSTMLRAIDQENPKGHRS